MSTLADFPHACLMAPDFPDAYLKAPVQADSNSLVFTMPFSAWNDFLARAIQGPSPLVHPGLDGLSAVRAIARSNGPLLSVTVLFEPTQDPATP